MSKKTMSPHSPLSFKTGLDTPWRDDLVFFALWFLLALVVFVPFGVVIVLLDWLVIPD